MSRTDRRRRRQAYARRLLRANFNGFLRANAKEVAVLVGSTLALMVATLLYRPITPYLKGFVHAVLLCALIGLVLLAFFMQTGAFQQLAGAWGEDNTRMELAKARKAGSVFADVSNIELAAGDIDHLVFTPAGVLAVESKWHFRAIPDPVLARSVEQAQMAARKASLILRSEHVKRPHSVDSVVVIWGTGRRQLPLGGLLVDGVQVVPGQGFVAWLERHRRGRFGRDYAEETAEIVQRFADTRQRKRIKLDR